MSTTTKNLGLLKPDLTDAADITAYNQNWDKLDNEVNNKLPKAQSSPDITNADMNQTTMVGFYRINKGDLNTPVNALAGHTALIIPWDVNTVYQIYFSGHTPSDIYVRDSYYNGSNRAWGEWVALDSGLDGKLDKNPAFIELKPQSGSSYGGYIDFHYGGSNDDYTSRIVEEDVGQLKIIANKIIAQGNMDGTFINLSGNLKVAGGYGVVSADQNASTLCAVHDLNNDHKRVFQVLNENYAGNIANALNLILKDASGTKNYLVYGEHNAKELGISRIVTRTYKGTGTNGASNPNIITYEKPPKMVIINHMDSFGGGFCWCYGSKYGFVNSSTGTTAQLTWTQTQLSWAASSASYQLNDSGSTYTYTLIY